MSARAGLAACLLAVLLAASARGGQELGPEYVARTPPLSPEEERAKLRLPPGFEAQLVAAEPDIRKPMNLAFDRRGRLWATESVEYPFPAKDGAEGRDSIKVFEDLDGDGRADRVTCFAGDLNIPIGLLPLEDGALVYSISRVHSGKGKLFYLRDADSDGRADERRELYGTFSFGDTHGMVNGLRLGLDGWVYACHGYANDSEVKGADGSSVRMNSGNIFRFRVDGSRVEQFTRGQVNPFGLCFDPYFNLYSADCHSQPAYQLLRGAYYPSFGKPHDGLGFGPIMVPHDHGSTGIGGIVYYAADHFPEEYRGIILLGNVITNRLNHDRLEWRGSTPRAVERPDFLVSEDPWFRPVDLQVGPDGALYVADFYNRIIGHYEVPLTHPGRDRERGRIWRIIYRGQDGRNAPRRPIEDLGRASTSELVEALAHPNLLVSTQATHELVRRGGRESIEGVQAGMRSSGKPRIRMHGLWVLERLGALDRTELRRASADGDPGVRVHVQRVLSERRQLEQEERELPLAALRDPDPAVQRAGADALGRHPGPENLGPLLDLRKKVPPEDSHLLHVVRMAIRNQLRLPESLATERPREEIGLILDCLPGVHSAASASFLLKHLPDSPPAALPEWVQYAARYLPEGEQSALEDFVRTSAPRDMLQRSALMGALHRGVVERGAELGKEMRAAAGELAALLLDSREPREFRAGINLARNLKLEATQERLGGIARSGSRSEEDRKLCLEALVALDPVRHVPLLGAVLGDPAEPFSLRDYAAGQLGDIRRPEALELLTGQLQSAPARLAVRIAVAMSRSRQGAERLLGEVERGKASLRLLKEREVEARLSRSPLTEVRERIEKLTAGLPEADQGVEKLIETRKAGFAGARADQKQGAAVFEKSCAPCHKLGEKGRKIGPELAGVGLRGIDRLLEDLLDPSRNVDRTFVTTVVIQKNNLVRAGLLLNDETEVLVLVDGEGKEVRIPKSDIKSREVSPLSAMPSNLAETLPEAEFYHLLAFLLGQKEKSQPAP